MTVNILKYCLPVAVAFIICAAAGDRGRPAYNFRKPKTVKELPDTLREISGVAALSPTAFACIQDENGIIFIYNSKNNAVEKQVPFGANGDYEGITVADDRYYILRSDGVLFETGVNAESPSAKIHPTGIPVADSEGLCLDKDNGRLLIGCKSPWPSDTDKRVIYAFDLETKITGKSPLFKYSVAETKKFAVAHKVPLKIRYNKKGEAMGPVLKFTISEIAIHPKTKDLYVLSSVDHLLLIYDPIGKLRSIEALDPVVFNKPEGLTFTPNGDLFITNEAGEMRARLLEFRYLK